jgi:uncharacterized membrane protein
MLGSIVTLTLTFIVFTFGFLLVAIQIAGGQLTPRHLNAEIIDFDEQGRPGHVAIHLHW